MGIAGMNWGRGWLCAAALCFGAAAGADSPLRPLLPEPLPDPSVFIEDGWYYVYGTGTHFFYGQRLEREAMRRGDLELDFGAEGGPFGIWGFKVYRHTDGAYHAYVTIHYGHFVTAVAHFVPQEGETWRPGAPIVKWKLNRVLVGDKSGNGPLAYDQNMVRDDDGTLYLIYDASPRRHTDVHILAQRMLDPATPDPDFPARPILSPEGYRSEDRNPGYIQIVEATNIARIAGHYVLIYSVGDFALYEGVPSNYKIGLAYSDVLIPPPGETYRKVVIPDPDHLWGNSGKDGEVAYLLQSQFREWPNYCGHLVEGPGVASILDIDGGYWLIFHGYPADGEAAGAHERYVWKLPLDVRIDPGVPRADWIRARLPVAPSGAAGPR